MDWDLVVLTASDDAQASAFTAQLTQLNLDTAKFRVFHDEPAGAKIGSGGATILALSKLHLELGARLFDTRVLLLNSGGFCQRQPNAAALGKLFTPLPPDESGRPRTLLHLKLQLYRPLLRRMRAGVFIAAADALEAMQLDGDEWTLANDGFTVLAHPNTVAVGRNHGVFVVERRRTQSLPYMTLCKRVLQKPSAELMRQSGAVFPDGADESVLTDSAFFMSAAVVRRIVDIFADEAPICAEVDVYGDFLQPLGRDATRDYMADTSRLAGAPSDASMAALVGLRGRLFDALHTFDAHAVVLPDSRFYHVGTIRELIHHLCDDAEFWRRFDLSAPTLGCGRIMYSELTADSSVQAASIVEYCSFQGACIVPAGCVLSNCASKSAFTIKLPIFATTIPVRTDGDELAFVCILLGIGDDTKSVADVGRLPYLGTTLATACDLWRLDKPSKTSLWTAPIHSQAATMEDAFRDCLQKLHAIESGESTAVGSTSPQWSVCDAIRAKDVKAMLHFRNLLIDKLTH